MPPPQKMRLTARVLKPPEQPITFLIAVESSATFAQVWKLIKQRYTENYSAGRKQYVSRDDPTERKLTSHLRDYFFKKIQDSSGADIDIRDTVIDIFGDIDDPSRRIVQIQQWPLGRDDTVPHDSHLHPPLVPPTPDQLQDINRRRSETVRYGAPLDILDPDHPVESHEPTAEPRIDKEGFAIPTKINRPSANHGPATSHAAPSSQAISQDSYEDHLARRASPELGSPHNTLPSAPRLATSSRRANTASQYSTLDAVPSAQKPPASVGNVGPDSVKDDMALDVNDPISDDSQPRLSNSALRTPAKQSTSRKRNNSDARGSSEARVQNLSGFWSEDEKSRMIEVLAKGLDLHDAHHTYFPGRSWNAVRKKATSITKSSGTAISKQKKALSAQHVNTSSAQPISTPLAQRKNTSSAQPRKSLSAQPKNTPPTQDIWTEEEDSYFVKAIKQDRTWEDVHDKRFRHRSDDSVKMHYAMVRQRLKAEDEAKSAQNRYQEQLQRGQPSTGPNEKFTEDEDDLLLACRAEGVEMKRAAREFFPLRPVEQVTKRAGTLYQTAKRTAEKSNPGLERSPSVEFLFEHDSSTRDRITPKLAIAREFKKKADQDRARETEEIAQSKARVGKDKERSRDRRVREREQTAFHNNKIEFEKKENSVKRRRLEDELHRDRQYTKDLAAWEEQAALDVTAGRSPQPRPVRPLGSSIGTEVLAAPLPSSSKPQPMSGSSDESGAKKRRFSDIRVVIPCPSTKKQKTDATVQATPMRQSNATKAKASTTSKAKPLATPKPTAGYSTRSAAAKAASIQKHSTTQAQDSNDRASSEDDEPVVTFSSFSTTEPLTNTKVAKESASQKPSSPLLSTAKKLRQSKLPWLTEDQQMPGLSARKSSPAGTTPRGTVDDSVFISSDDELSYDDKDITDEEYNAVAERSEAMYSSSPVKHPKEDDGKEMETSVHKTVFAGGPPMQSSPPVASMPTPRARTLLRSDFESAMKEKKPLRSTMPSRFHDEDVQMMDADPTGQDQELLGADIKTTTQEGASQSSDTRVERHKLSTIDKSNDEPSAEESDDASSSPAPSSESHADENQLREELARSTQPREDETAQTLRDDASQDGLHNAPLSEADNQAEIPSPGAEDIEEIQCWRSESGESALEDDASDCHSDSLDREIPFPTKLGPFTIPQTERIPVNQSTSQLRPTSTSPMTASKENRLGEKTSAILRSPSVTNMAPPFPSSGKIKTSSSTHIPNDKNGSMSSPTAHLSGQSPDVGSSAKRTRRSNGRQLKKKGSRILADAHPFAPPPSTAPPDILTGLSSRKQSKSTNQDATERSATQTNGNSHLSPPKKTSAKQAAIQKRKSLDPLEAVHRAIRASQVAERNGTLQQELDEWNKLQALGRSSSPELGADPVTVFQKSAAKKPALSKTANKPVSSPTTKEVASSQSAKKVTLSSQSTKTAKPSQVVSQPGSGRVVNKAAFDWDNQFDAAEAHRLADKRLRDAAEMPREEFWQPFNLQRMNDGQVFSHMIEQGVKQSMEESKARRDKEAAFFKSATQPVSHRAMASSQSNGVGARPATQPAKKSVDTDDSDSSSSSDDSDSDEDDGLTSLIKRSEAAKRQSGVSSLRHW